MLNIPELPHPPHKLYRINPTESHLYTLTLNGQPCPVRKCFVSAHPFNRVWPGKQRDFSQAEEAAFAFFSTDGAVEAEVEVAEDFTGEAVIRPLSAGIKVARNGRKLKFTLPGPGQFVLETGSDHNVLQIFADPVWKTTDAEKKNATYSFGPGIHFPGRIVLKSGDSVYIDPGALVYGEIFGLNVENVRIFGGGILDGSTEERVFGECYEPYPVSTFKFYRSKNIRVEGVTILNSACWTMNFFCCSDIEIDRVKITGQWRYNTDGIDLCSVQRAKITNSYVRSFDDTIVLKALDFYRFQDGMWETGRNEEDIEVRSCVLWCDWGRTCEVGIETGAKEYRNIIFEDCDLIHNSHVAIDIQNGCGADIHDVIFRDLRVEYQAHREASVYQESDDMVYDPNPKYCVPTLIWSDNNEFSLKAFDPEYDVINHGPGCTHDILYENIQVFAEDGLPGKLPVHICCTVPGTPFFNHTIRNLTVNGRKVTSFDEFAYETNDDVRNTVLE